MSSNQRDLVLHIDPAGEARRGIAAFAFGERRHIGRDAIGDPVHGAEASAALEIIKNDGETLGVGRRIRPIQRQGNIVAATSFRAGKMPVEESAILELR
jgi:hypothetical protein